jgi:trehalose 6-phosphate synthase/phosphatase
MTKRLFIVANRLPVQLTDDHQLKPSAGGLVSAINSYLNPSGGEAASEYSATFWVGVPGCTPATWDTAAASAPVGTYTYVPVFAAAHHYDAYYNGFSNSALWPLFHYFPSFAEYQQEAYEAYLAVNESFAAVLTKHLRPDDVVWIHDYHLLPLAAMIRQAVPSITIGFFLHIPFPSFELIRLLPRPWQETLLQGMLGADLIGFHTIDYAAHFLQSVQMVLGLDHEMHVLRHDDRLIKVDVFPISIDYDCFCEGYDKREVAVQRVSVRENLPGKKIIFSVDRLDYTKGVHNRLKAYECFLTQYPQYREKVVFIIVVVPSRDTVTKYAERKKMIDEAISGINSRVGTLHWQPIIYQYNTLSFEQMVALYTACDLALITPMRDGMNLVAKEFVASRKDRQGVLVLSEMAGAARELTDALTINPNDIGEIAGKIKEGLEMLPAEQARRLQAMQDRIRTYNVRAWAEDFLGQLALVKRKQQDFQVLFLDDYSRRGLLDAYRTAARRLLLLDYDGTLVPFSANPGEAKPGAHLLSVLGVLSRQPQNVVCIVSGRSSDWLEACFGHLPLMLVAEHGARLRRPDGTWHDEAHILTAWKGEVQRIMDSYARRCAGSFTEVKNFSVVWHYRNAVPAQARLRSMELLAELNEHIHNRGLQVLPGNKIVEVRSYGINKGTAVKKLLEQYHPDFVLAAGDDRTDEDMFRLLANQRHCYSIKVGPEASFARYNLHTQGMVVSVLEAMSHIPYTGAPTAGGELSEERGEREKETLLS